MIGSLLSTADLERIASQYNEPVRSPTNVRTRSATPLTAGQQQGQMPTWSSISTGCDALREWAGIADGLPEPQWYALASVVGLCSDGRELFHAMSKHDLRYSAEETDRKLDQAISASGPRLCTSVRALGGKCDACPFILNSPISLGYAQDPVIVELARYWVYVVAQDGFVELPREASA
jgi:hypothetical protein